MKQNAIFLTCLPRGRSAWWSNYLSYNGAAILHDAFYGLEDVKHFPRELREFFPGAKVIGNSDPANLLFWEQIVEWFPDAKWVVIERPFEEVVKSCQKICPIERPALWAMADKLSELIGTLKPMVVDFHSITPEVAMNVAEYCGIDAGNLKRAEQLCRMNVQLEPSYLKQALKDFGDNPSRWMSKE